MPSLHPTICGVVTDGARGREIVPVDPRVRDSLCALARRYDHRGVRVFLFGSTARTWPRAPVGADFDLGYEMVRSGGDGDARRRDLEREVGELPSIRPVDLVDFSRVTEAFRTEAAKHIVELAHEPSAAATG